MAGALREVIADNQKTAVDFIRKNLPGVRVDMPEGTYMLFLVARKVSDAGVVMKPLQKRGIAAGVIWQDGRPFYGENHIRLNRIGRRACSERRFAGCRRSSF